jgi:hypothetical protein
MVVSLMVLTVFVVLAAGFRVPRRTIIIASSRPAGLPPARRFSGCGPNTGC